jgi:hypothetical protein
MQLSSVIQLARTYLQTDSNGLLDADAIQLANEALLSDTTELIHRGINAAQVMEAYMNATAGVGIYSFPDGVTSTTWTLASWSGSGTPPELFMVKTMNVNYQDQTESNYQEVTIMDSGNLPQGQSYQWLRGNQSMQNPLMDNRGATFEIFPAPIAGQNLTAFFYMLYFVAPVQYSSDGSTIAYPFNLNPNVLASRIAWLHATRGDEESMARAASYGRIHDVEMDKLENILKKGTQKSTSPQGIAWTGNEF